MDAPEFYRDDGNAIPPDRIAACLRIGILLERG
jgi:hypothetical protein